MFNLAFLFCFCSTMKRKSVLRYIDIRGLSYDDRKAALKKIQFPDRTINDDDFAVLTVGKKYIFTTNTEMNNLYFIRYDTTDEIVRKQLTFHSLLFKHLQLSGLFSLEGYCLVDEKKSYLAYTQRTGMIFYMGRLSTLTTKQIVNGFSNVLEIFRILENNNAVLIDPPLNTLSLSLDNEIYFGLEDLNSVYENNQMGYAKKSSLTEEELRSVNPTLFKIGMFDEEFSSVIVTKKLHRKSFIDFLENYMKILFRLSPNHEDALLQSFWNKLIMLNVVIGLIEHKFFTWRVISNFVRSVGTKGILAEAIGKTMNANETLTSQQ